MNSKKAKALRQLAKDVFLHKLKEKDNGMKAQNLGERIYMENTTREKWEEYPEMTQIKEPNPAGPTEPDIIKMVHQTNEDGSIKMKRYKMAMGTITLHALCERGIYRHFKKIFKRDQKNFIKNVTRTA